MTNPNEDKEDLARRAVACKGWRWSRGMRTLRFEGRFWTAIPWLAGIGFAADDGCEFHMMGSLRGYLLPDLADPATLGCLRALVREAWGNETISVQADGRRWVVRGDEFVLFTLYGEPRFDSEAHALVAALEAAP